MHALDIRTNRVDIRRAPPARITVRARRQAQDTAGRASTANYGGRNAVRHRHARELRPIGDLILHQTRRLPSRSMANSYISAARSSSGRSTSPRAAQLNIGVSSSTIRLIQRDVFRGQAQRQVQGLLPALQGLAGQPKDQVQTEVVNARLARPARPRG